MINEFYNQLEDVASWVSMAEGDKIDFDKGADRVIG